MSTIDRARVRLARDRLAAATLRLNDVISRAERVFWKLTLPAASVPVRYEPAPGRGRRTEHRLAWGLLLGQWRLLLESRPSGSPGAAPSVTLLLASSRETRIAGVSLLKELHSAATGASVEL